MSAPTIVAAPRAGAADVDLTLRLGRYAAAAFKYLTLVLGSLATATPIIAIIFISFKSLPEYKSTSKLTPPKDWTNVDNYVEAFTKGGMLHAFGNTLFILAFSIVGTILIGTMAAYAIDRFQFRFKKLAVGAFLLATLVPGVTTQVATFQIVHSLGIYNTRWAAIALFMGTDIVSIYIFVQFMRGIPKELDEAAVLDGAGHVRIFFQVIFPLLKPAIATVVIIKGIGVYNEFYTPFLYMPNRDLAVISTSLFRFQSPFASNWPVIAAGVMIVMIPTLVAFLSLQKYIYNGFTSGATK